MIVKDKLLRATLQSTSSTDAERFDERPELQYVLRRWRPLAEEYDPRLLLGETDVAGSARLARLRRGRRAQLAFNFPFLRAPFHAEPLLQFVADTEAALPEGAWAVWTGSNHDHSRFPTAGTERRRRIRLGLLMLLTLKGTPVSTTATRSACRTRR